MLLKLPALLLCAVILPTRVQSDAPRSPCPSVFTYDTKISEPNRWYGKIKLSTDITLHSLYLTNWLGNVTSNDNLVFNIENMNITIRPGPPLIVFFFVQYNPSSQPPKLQTIRLNGREICFAGYTEDFDLDRIVFPSTIPKIETTTTLVPPLPFSIPPSPTNNTSSSVPLSINPTIGINSEDEQCGKVVLSQPHSLVVKGKPTFEGQWPWQIALYYARTTTLLNEYRCGGTLISKSHVITAAHCVLIKHRTRVVNKNILTVYLGKHNLRTSVEGVQIKFVNKIIMHPRYNATTHENDLAILELREDITISDWVRPACLWPEDEVDLTNVIGKTGSVVGWGFDETGQATEELILAEMPVPEPITCIRSELTHGFFLRYTNDYTYCAGKNGSFVCNGDSGGGMVFKKNNIWYLRGLVSLSVAKPNSNICDYSHYVIFTDLAKYLDWIKEVINETKNNN